jgi:transcription termination factor Rho
MDQVIFEDFKGTGNAELVLHRPLAERRIFPAIDINASGTRKEEKLRHPMELERVYRMRRALAQFKPIEAMEALIPRVQKWPSNSAFLAQFDVTSER